MVLLNVSCCFDISLRQGYRWNANTENLTYMKRPSSPTISRLNTTTEVADFDFEDFYKQRNVRNALIYCTWADLHILGIDRDCSCCNSLSALDNLANAFSDIG